MSDLRFCGRNYPAQGYWLTVKCPLNFINIQKLRICNRIIAKNIRSGKNRPCPVRNKPVCPGEGGAYDIPRHGKNISALLCGKPCSYKRAAPFTRFNDNRAVAQTRYYSVPYREILTYRRCVWRVFAYYRPVLGNVFPQSAVIHKIFCRKPAAEHRDGFATAEYSAGMGSTVNTQSTSADYNRTRPCEGRAESARHIKAMPRSGTSADNGNRYPVFQALQIAPYIEHCRIVANFKQQRGIE